MQKSQQRTVDKSNCLLCHFARPSFVHYWHLTGRQSKSNCVALRPPIVRSFLCSCTCMFTKKCSVLHMHKHTQSHTHTDSLPARLPAGLSSRQRLADIACHQRLWLSPLACRRAVLFRRERLLLLPLNFRVSPIPHAGVAFAGAFDSARLPLCAGAYGYPQARIYRRHVVPIGRPYLCARFFHRVRSCGGGVGGTLVAPHHPPLLWFRLPSNEVGGQ